ncbi:MAG: putative 2-aminoethylphosphonate ABC transporter permease subunit [Calditerrivibrio sp.]|nr:putative 2-aminoethylphosphonate ABC transporter permease subunit [Calditerrivibrio sp.]MCA1931988.1 putative 2-aminoethylphosphonate ABC transporter permease subunit [Calditerrivibrio sp.]MCA1980174.1 putative 2-aminoethylphosphonate ABC transporter permease subunit [Calditerrivibrio sp.]
MKVFNSDRTIVKNFLFFYVSFLLVTLILPMFNIFKQSLLNSDGDFVMFSNFVEYFHSPHLLHSLWNSILVSIITTLISVFLSFVYAYAIYHRKIGWSYLFNFVAILPLLATTMMHGISLVYLFGNQGFFSKIIPELLNEILGTNFSLHIPIYGFLGIIISEVIYTFPQSFMILAIAFSFADKRLYEAAETLGASPIKKFFTVTLPSLKYGLLSATITNFILSFTDFGAPKIIGGTYNVIAVDIYKQVVGQQNIPMGATVGIILLIPSFIAFIADRFIQNKRSITFTSKSVPYTPKKHRIFDNILKLYCITVAILILLIIGTSIFASFIKNWPYNFQLTLEHYTFKDVAGGMESYFNSILISIYTAVTGTILIFSGAYLVEKSKIAKLFKSTIQLLALLPLAIPGLVIGVAYILFFNTVEFNIMGFNIVNPFNFLYGTYTIMVISNIIHFFSVPFLTALTGLKKLDNEYETVSESLSVPFYKFFTKVTLPMSITTIIEIFFYLFVNSMVTVSALVFLYTYETRPATVAIINMEEAGDVAAAAAMSSLIIFTNLIFKVIFDLLMKSFRKRSDRWLKH